MATSPLRSLLSKHLCSCHTSNALRGSQNHVAIRSISNGLPKRQPNAPSISSYKTPEMLKERYKNTPPPKGRSEMDRAKAFKRMRKSGLGILACAACMIGAVYVYSDQLPAKTKTPVKTEKVTSFDAPPSIAGISTSDSTSNDVEQIPTGTSTIPTFPRTIYLPSSSPDTPSSLKIDNQEYQLVGLGIRTVSFLSIQVYVVGLYIALPDVAVLQEKLIRKVDPVATTLVAGEKAKLKEMLLDPELSEDIWNSVLKDAKMRTALRIVPTRNTDFMHLRDGWVRGITARTQHFAGKKGDQSFSDDSFGLAVNEFKAIWGGGARKNVPKGETLLLKRDAQGALEAVYEDKSGDLRLGGVADERVSRLIWLGYLGGKNVSSEGARENIVHGVIEYVERPVGTVAAQVV